MFALDGIDHVALAVKDVERSVAWYKDVLGLERRYQDAWGSYPAVVGAGTTSIALFPVDGPEPKPCLGSDVLAMRHFAFRTDRANFNLARRELSQRGILLHSEHHGISESFYFQDPDGHELEITTYEL
ncbi:MAG TPA: VOC family protein [Planctomycetaceae bacterium]|jgi:catechol 2,3-dioxygenase-like lactoylglutathione lyase family enzyme|nr:VOC family protein [Planctomycetaceae bacterium]